MKTIQLRPYQSKAIESIKAAFTDLRELTPEVLRTFIERIIIHERTAKHSKSATRQIDIYFRYIGKLMPEEVA
ncbi:MAG: DUF4368 domain-containing protein [Clostridia bacterium]|nr:DUF4368 domain-containing protein [Clostridia bacterium]